MAAPLTSRQKQIYDFLVKAIQERGYAPSIGEICARFEIASTNGVFRHLQALEKKGFIRRIGKRAIDLMNPQGRSVFPSAREVPIVGLVPAGKPLLAEENIEGFLTVGSDLARGTVFALRVKGDSMVEAGILEGDYVIVRRQTTAENGEIVCALVNGEATLKRFFRQGGAVTLKPENKNYSPLKISRGEFRIVGKVAGLVRKF